MQIPQKMKSGDSWRRGTFDKINEIIDYLKTQRLSGDNKTILLNQNTSGITIRAVAQSKGGVTSAVSNNHPFKLYVTKDGDGKPQISMQEGRILLQSTDNTPIAYRYQVTDQNDHGAHPIASYLPIDWDNQDDGEYLVIGVLRVVMQNGVLGYNGVCLVVGGAMYIQDIPCCQGYCTFYIGTVSKQTMQDETYKLKIVNNRITSDLIVNDFMLKKPFNVYAVISHGDADEIKTAYTDWTIQGLYCNSGIAYDDLTRQDNTLQYQGGFSPSAGANYLYCVQNKEDQTIQLQWTNQAKQAYVQQDDQLIEKNYLIAVVLISNRVVAIMQHIDTDIILNQSDTYKFLIDNGDVENQDSTPNYAVSKLYGEYGTLQGDTQTEYQGYIGVYQQANEYSDKQDELALKFKWVYDEISGYSTSDYIQLNANGDALAWQPAYRVRVNQADTNPAFLWDKLEQGDHINLSTVGGVIGIDAEPPTITGVSPIIATVDAGGWNFTISFDDSQFVKTVTGTSCITATRSGTAVTLAADLQCIFQNFSITGNSPITVSGSGQSWTIGFDDSGFIKSIVNGTCITTSKNGSAVTVNVDKTCVFQNFSITGDNYIGVSGSGQSWALSFNDSGLVKTISAGTCINVSRSGSTATIGVDKSCVFQNFSIAGSSPISVSGSGQSWSIGFDDAGFIKNITSQDGTVGISRSGSTVDLSVLAADGKVKVNASDTLDYLGTKFENSNGYINFQIGNKIEAELGADAVQSDGSIEVDCTNGFALIDVDWTKVVIDPSLAPLISRSINNETLTLSLNAPATGKYVLMSNNGVVSWVGVGQCPGEEEEEQ